MKLPSRAAAKAFLDQACSDPAVRDVIDAFTKDMQLVQAIARVHLDLEELDPAMLLALTERLDKYFCEPLDAPEPPQADNSAPQSDSLDSLLFGHDQVPGLLISREAPLGYGELDEDDRFFYWGDPCTNPECVLHHPPDVSNDGLRSHLLKAFGKVLSYLPENLVAGLRQLLTSPDTRFTMTPTGILARRSTRYN